MFLGAVLRRVAPLCAVLLSAVLFSVVRLVPWLAVSCSPALSVALGSWAFWRCVLWCFPRCVLCAVCVLPWCGGVCCCSLLFFVLWLFTGVLLCVPCPPCSVRRCATLCWCASVVLLVWSSRFSAPGPVVCCCVLCCCSWCAMARCWVLVSAVVLWWRVLVLVSLSGRVACFPVVGVVCCAPLLPCAAFSDDELSCGAVLPCSAVFLRRCLCFLFLFSLKNHSKTRKMFFQLLFFVFFFRKQNNYTRSNTPASSKTMYATVTCLLHVNLDVLGLVILLVVVKVVGVHC